VVPDIQRDAGIPGAPPATGGLDIWIRPTPDNAARVLEALRTFGAALFDLTIDEDPPSSAPIRV
jgi:hypothetical protein